MKRITIFVNGNHITFDYMEKVQKNLFAWLKKTLDNPEKISKWHSEIHSDGGQALDIALKGSQVDGFYIIDTPPVPNATPALSDYQRKTLDLLKRIVDGEDESWKKS